MPATFHGFGEAVLVACSGGGDSIALLHLAVAELGAAQVHVATINHNLRDVQDELSLVARHCAKLGVAHAVLDWHWDGRGNLQAAARDGRRALLRTHAARIGATAILLGHTQDDQAETVLMRLARGSGVDGLAGMAPVGELYARPLLEITRAELRDWLQAKGLDWAEDPSNDDCRFDRVKARAMMGHLAELGLTPGRLAATADRMRDEREALVSTTLIFGLRHSRTISGDVLVDAAAFTAMAPALQTRALAAILNWFSGQPYKPRASEMRNWHGRILTGKPAPLSGVLACFEGDRLSPDGAIRFYREPAAVAPAEPMGPAPGTVIWDNRWHIAHTGCQTGCSLAALGEGLREVPNWQDHGLPRISLETSPAIWRDGALQSALLFDLPEGWRLGSPQWWQPLKQRPFAPV